VHLTKRGQVDYDCLTLGQLKQVKISLFFVLFIHVTILCIYNRVANSECQVFDTAEFGQAKEFFFQLCRTKQRLTYFISRCLIFFSSKKQQKMYPGHFFSKH